MNECCYCPAAKLCLCDPTDCSPPGFPLSFTLPQTELCPPPRHAEVLSATPQNVTFRNRVFTEAIQLRPLVYSLIQFH